MSDLDNTDTYTDLDPSRLRHRLRDFPRLCSQAWQQSHSPYLPDEWRACDNVVIGGMGGSAIAGDLVADLSAAQRAVPITVVRDFHLPFGLSKRSLFICSSFSGDTEETLSLFQQALRDQARVLVVAGGGTLAEAAQGQNVPRLTVDAPGEPRSALGYSLMLILGALQRLGLVETTEDDAQCAVAALTRQVSRLGEEVPTRENPAKQLARELEGRLVVVYGAGIFLGVARRWKTQLNENAKVWACFESIPELLHNSVEAYVGRAADGHSKQVLMLQPHGGAEELKGRYRAVADLLLARDIPNQVLAGTDSPGLSQQLDMVLLGDYVSYYLALLQGIDPSPTPTINQAKQLTARRRPNVDA